jgi:glycosyltransferase involved in cell wall biosynthesis
MSMGRPIITTDAPGCKETVKHGISGYIVPKKNVSELVSSLKKFIQDPKSIANFGKESHAIAVEKYDVHKVNQAIISALNL